LEHKAYSALQLPIQVSLVSKQYLPAAIPEGIPMSEINQPSKQTNNAAGKQNSGKSTGIGANAGGKPADPLLKPRPQTLPMKK